VSGFSDSTDEPNGEPRATRSVPPPSDAHAALLIRPAAADDTAAIARIIVPTIRAGETYALDRDMTEADALAYWLGRDDVEHPSKAGPETRSQAFGATAGDGAGDDVGDAGPWRDGEDDGGEEEGQERHVSIACRDEAPSNPALQLAGQCSGKSAMPPPNAPRG
jgi:hypothetical protein